jgi:hypothetical protein
MQISIGDYVIVTTGPKSSVVKVVKTTNQMLEVKNQGLNDETTLINRDFVVCNLGAKPKYGQAYKAVVEPHVKTISHDIGPVHIFKYINKEEWLEIKKQLNMMFDFLNLNIPSILPIEVYVRNESRRSDFKFNEDINQLNLRAKPGSEFNSAMSAIGQVLFPLIEDQFKILTIREFHKLVMLQTVTVDQLQELKEKYQASDGSKFLKKGLDDGEKAIMGACFKHVKSIHGLSIINLDLLVRSNKKIDRFWPTVPLQLTAMEPSISDLAMKSPENLFSEGLMMYAADIQLPAKLESIIHEAIKLLDL